LSFRPRWTCSTADLPSIPSDLTRTGHSPTASPFVVMEELGITDALATDRDFKQAGFVPPLQ
jgi:hypothetical protein